MCVFALGMCIFWLCVFIEVKYPAEIYNVFLNKVSDMNILVDSYFLLQKRAYSQHAYSCVFYKFEILRQNIMHIFEDIKKRTYAYLRIRISMHKYASCIFMQKYVHACFNVIIESPFKIAKPRLFMKQKKYISYGNKLAFK